MVKHLGVQAPTAAQVYRSDILPQLTALPRSVRDTAMLLMLRHLPDVLQQDSGFGQLLAQMAFLPSGKGELHVPSELYDPRSPELAALLDPDACFPAPAFCGDVADATQDEQRQRRGGSSSSGSFSTLAVLQQLGLRSSAQLDTLVAAARYVERVVAEGDEDMAVARGKVCVRQSVCLSAERHTVPGTLLSDDVLEMCGLSVGCHDRLLAMRLADRVLAYFLSVSCRPCLPF